MNSKTIILITVLFTLIVIGMFIFTYLKSIEQQVNFTSSYERLS